MNKADKSLLCLDVGAVRIGVARANAVAKIAEPLTTLANDDSFAKRLQEIIETENINLIIVGLPQNQSYEDTEQTKFVRDFIKKLKKTIDLKFVFQDEADSSLRARAILFDRGKDFPKEAIDAEAATLILQDYIEERQ